MDKDRAAAVIIGESKDLKSAMRGKRRRDRNAADANVIITIKYMLRNHYHNIIISFYIQLRYIYIVILYFRWEMKPIIWLHILCKESMS